MNVKKLTEISLVSEWEEKFILDLFMHSFIRAWTKRERTRIREGDCFHSRVFMATKEMQ